MDSTGQWPALLNTAMNIRDQYKVGNFLPASQEGVCCLLQTKICLFLPIVVSILCWTLVAEMSEKISWALAELLIAAPRYSTSHSGCQGNGVASGWIYANSYRSWHLHSGSLFPLFNNIIVFIGTCKMQQNMTSDSSCFTKSAGCPFRKLHVFTWPIISPLPTHITV
jgi:hypothetical protein